VNADVPKWMPLISELPTESLTVLAAMSKVSPRDAMQCSLY
jgi:hypothetical protein